jgi:hypothetical protein
MNGTSDPSADSELYSVHPSVFYARSILDNLADRTGRSLEDWIQLLHEASPDARARRNWLVREQGLGATTASMIAEQSLGMGAEKLDPAAYLKAAAGYVDAMYSGAKAGLRPIHDSILKFARTLGSDVKVCPVKTVVPLYRRHVFAQIKPAARNRLDLGLALGKTTQELPHRLEEILSMDRSDRITHRFALGTVQDFDGQVMEWLRIAYATDL